MRGSSLKSLALSLRQMTADVTSDLYHSVHYWKHNLKGNRVHKKFLSNEPPHPPVVLLQGFMGTRGVLHPLENYLRHHGRDVISIDLGLFNIQDIRRSAQYVDYKVERFIQKYCEPRGIQQIDLIGHSMGGLTALHYVKDLGGQRVVRKLITLGAPFHGTWASLLAVFPVGLVSKAVWQMLPTSKLLRSIRTRHALSMRTEIISIAARHDALCPPRVCKLPRAKNLIVPKGHASLLMDEAVFELIRKELDRVSLRLFKSA